jgi:WD40 repeat protein
MQQHRFLSYVFQTTGWKANDPHTMIINNLEACGNGQLGSGPRELVTASRDGHAKVWDTRVPNAVLTIKPPCGDADCWSVCFGDAYNSSDRCIVAGYDTGHIRMLDLRTVSMRWETKVNRGICHLSFDRQDIPMNKLHAACLEGYLYTFDMRTQHPESGFDSHAAKVCDSTLWGCHILPQDRDLSAATTGDGCIRLFKYEYPTERSKKDISGREVGVAGNMIQLGHFEKISSQPAITFQWNRDKRGLCAYGSFDETVRVGYFLGL